MKSVMIIYNQVLDEELLDLLDRVGVRGFTRWNNVQGRGTKSGVPHFGSHTWPALNGAMLCIVDDEEVDPLLDAIRDADPDGRGLRAFVWQVERFV